MHVLASFNISNIFLLGSAAFHETSFKFLKKFAIDSSIIYYFPIFKFSFNTFLTHNNYFSSNIFFLTIYLDYLLSNIYLNILCHIWPIKMDFVNFLWTI